MEKKIITALIVVAVILVGFLAWFFVNAGLLGDGINIDPDNGIVQSKINEPITVGDITIIALEVIEDSRCPTDAICIQSGTVRIKAKVSDGLNNFVETFTLNQVMSVGSKTIELIRVRPEASTRNPSLEVTDYQFIWQVDPIN